MQMGSLTFEMAANVASLRRDMDQALGHVQRTSAAMQRAASAAGAALGAIGAGVSVGALSAWVKSSIDAADQFDEMSGRIGISAHELSSLQVAFTLAGVPVDKMGDSLAKLQKEMADGNKGLAALGIQSRAADGSMRGTTEVLIDLAEQFAGIKDGAGKTALAMEIFGKSGADMVPLLNSGADGIRDMITQAERLGIVLDDETAAAAGKFNDTLDLIGMGTRGVGQRVAAELLPTLQALGDAFLTAATEGDGLSKVSGVLSTALKGLYSSGAFVVQTFSAIGTSLGAAGAMVAAVLRGEFAQAVEINRQSQADIKAGWASFGTSMDKLWSGSAGSGVAALTAVGAASKREAPNIAAAGKAAGEGWVAGREAAQEWAKAFADFAKMVEDAQAKSLGLSKAQARLLQYLSSPAYAEHTEQMRELVLQQAHAAIAAERLAEAEEATAKWSKESADANAAHVESLQAQTAKLQEQLAAQRDANAAAGLSEQAQRALAAARLDEAAAALEQRARWAEESMLSAAVVEQYRAQATAQRDLAAAKREAAAAEQARKDKETVDKFTGAGASTDYSAGFDRSSAALGVFLQQFGKLVDMQAEYDAARKAAGSDAVQLAKVEAAATARQVNSWGNLAGAAKGYFKEGSKGYKALEAAEKTFRAMELVLALKSAAQKLGLIESITVAKVAGDQAQAASATASVGPEVAASMAKGQASATAAVANQGNGDPYSAFFRIAAMVALMAGLGFAVRGGSGGGGGGSAAARQAANGTGTVLGDPSAKSESISRALEMLGDVDAMTMKYSSQMAASLRNIEAAMAGVATQILKANGLTTGSNLGIVTGTQRNVGDPMLKMSGLPGLKMLDEMTRKLPIIGGVLTKLTGLWGSTKTDITDTGLAIKGRASDLMAGQGAQQYADVQTRTSSWFGLSKSSRTDTVTQALGGEMTRQFGLVFSEVGTSLTAAAAALGRDTSAIGRQVADYVIDIPRLSLQGLSGDALQEAISSAVGATADRMARAIQPGLDDFQRVGEGYYETVVRVATSSESAQQALRSLGLQMVDITQVVNKQAQDIGAEVARASILKAEGGGSSITAITNALSGTAPEIVEAYKGLLGVRDAMRQLGFGATDASQDLLAGAGGLDQLQSGLEAFRAKFATESQSTALLTRQMAVQFERLGFAMPASAQGFSALVHGIDATTDSGKRQLGALLSLSGAYADYLDATGQATVAARSAADVASERAGLEKQLLQAQGNTKALRDLELAALDESNRALQERIWALQEDARIAAERAGLEKQLLQAQGNTKALRDLELAALDESNRALQERIWALQDEAKRSAELAAAGKGIAAYIAELRGSAGGGASLGKLRADYQATLTSAQGGDVTASGQIVADAKALLERVKAAATDPLAYARESARIATQLQALPATQTYEQQQAAAMAAVQGNTAGMVAAVQPLQPLLERIATATEQQAAGAGQGGTAAPLLPVVPGPVLPQPAGPAVPSVPVLPADGGLMTPGISGPTFVIAGNPFGPEAGVQAPAQPVQQAEMATVAANAKAVKMASAAAQAQGAAAQAVPAVQQAAGDIKRVQAFASGGDFGGGLRLVGEHGPELEVTGPSRIFNAGQTADILGAAGRVSDGVSGGSGGSAMLSELQASRAELANLRAELEGLRSDQRAQAAAIAGATQTTARILTRITPDGDALATREAEAI